MNSVFTLAAMVEAALGPLHELGELPRCGPSHMEILHGLLGCVEPHAHKRRMVIADTGSLSLSLILYIIVFVVFFWTLFPIFFQLKILTWKYINMSATAKSFNFVVTNFRC